jgi:dTDP-4-dehydrorhamnose 3,5-epimerase
MIEGVKVKELRFHLDERGRLLEILRCDEEIFKAFGQVYITTVNPGIIKGWHMHKKQTDNLCCVKGNIKLVLYDSRSDSSTRGEIQEFFMGDFNPILVQIPPQVYHAIKCIGNEDAIILNVPDLPYNHRDPDEYRLDPFTDQIPYDWNKVHG